MKKNFLIIAHKYLPHPDDDLVSYLNQNKTSNVLHIKHSFPDSLDRKSCYTWYKKGKAYEEKCSKDYYGWPEWLLYLKELFFTLVWTLRTREKWDFCIGMDGLSAIFGQFLKFLGKARSLIYWNIDFVPKGRFKSNWKNSIYHKINKVAVLQADQLWDLSPRMKEAREEFMGIKPHDYKEYKIVPYGVWTERIEKYNYNDCEKNTLVFMGHLLPKQGVDVVIKKIGEIVKVVPNFSFKIIGDGRERDNLVALAKKLKITKYCKFMGRLESKFMEKEIGKSCVAIAPYIKSLDIWTYYADPGKVKTYLACGVPVLLTDVPWNAQQIEEKQCGFIIQDMGTDLVEKLKALMNPKINQKYRNNAINYSKNFNYENIFKKINFTSTQ